MTSQSPSSILHLEVWTRYFGNRYSINTLELKWIQKLLNPTSALWKSLMLYRLNLKLNSNQSLGAFKQKQILRSTRHKNLQNQNKRLFRKYNAIYRIICDTYDNTQSLKCE